MRLAGLDPVEPVQGQALGAKRADLGFGLVAPALAIMLTYLQREAGTAEGMELTVRMQGRKRGEGSGLSAVATGALGEDGRHGFTRTPGTGTPGKVSHLRLLS